MSKFWPCQTAVGLIAVVALAASTCGLLAAPEKVLVANDSATTGSTTQTPAASASEPLKELIAQRLDHIISRKRDRDGVAAFYRDNGYAPIWISQGAPNLRTTAVTALMRAADADGLDPASYRVPDFRLADSDPKKLAEAELRLTDAVLTYARHAKAGRFSAQRLTTELEVTQTLSDAAAVLTKIAHATDAASALASYNPPQPGYKALKAKLDALRRSPAPSIVIPDGPVLKRGMTDARVPLLRKRLHVAGKTSDTTYDDAVAAALRAFQQDASLEPDGVLGPHSLAALNGTSPRARIDTVIANMERWRWLPRDLGSVHVLVNIPDFTLKVVDRDKTIWSTRIVVGKPDTPTPLVSGALDTVQLNPTWHVPESIIYNEYLPALQQDPHVLERMGLVLEHDKDGRITVRQPPGEENALGQIKFNFTNRFHVYLHDTPTKHLFARARRAFSHGCMRVENPSKFGEVLLSIANPKDDFTVQRLQRSWGGPEQWIKLHRKIPVHLVYMTATVDDHGKLIVRDDIYRLDKRTTAILKGDDSGVTATYTASSQKPPVVDAEKRRELERLVAGADGRPPLDLVAPGTDGRRVLAPFEPGTFHGRDGFDFFERLFR